MRKATDALRVIAIAASLAAPIANAAAAPAETSAKAGTAAKKSPSIAKAKAGGQSTRPSQPNRPSKGAPTGKTARKAANTDPESLRRMQAAQAAERARLAAKLAAVQRAIAANEASRSEAADALATSERSISDANRRLRELTEQQRTVQAHLAELALERAAKAAQIETQQTALASIVRDRYMKSSRDPMKLTLSGGNPNDIARDRVYLAYITQATAELLAGLHDNAARLDDLAKQTHAQNEALMRVASEEEATRANLAKEEDARRAALARVSKKLEGQRLEASSLAADEKRLARVVEDLQRVLDRQEKERARAERARERARRSEREANAHAGRNDVAKRGAGDVRTQARVDSSASADEAGDRRAAKDDTNGDFAKLKGHLRLPVRGTLTARYGSQRGDGGASWKGIFIRAASGVQAHAVAAGRVVFSDWLRGFGNLLIVDHGDQYLSIYGNNESLLKHAGDRVRTGDALATVGNSGGNSETGLYFELRYRGKPFDPLSWASLR